MITPNTGALQSIMQAGGAFSNPVSGPLSVTTGVVQGLQGSLQTAISSGNAVVQTALQPVAVAVGAIIGVGGALTSLGTHVANQISNLPQTLSIYTSVTAGGQGLGDRGAFPDPTAPDASEQLANICDGARRMFGSIMGAANELLSQIQAGIAYAQQQITALIAAIQSAVQSAIDAALALVQSAINTVLDYANQIADMIRREIAEIGQALANMLGLSGALSLRSLRNHPCVQLVLGAVGTPQFLNVLNQPAPETGGPPAPEPDGLPTVEQINNSAPLPGETPEQTTARRRAELEGYIAQCDAVVLASGENVGAINVARQRRDLASLVLRIVDTPLP